MKNRKVFVTAPWKIELQEDVFTEEIEKPDEIIVRNMYSHISAGTEMACVSGIEEWFSIPDVPGYTAVGEIIEKGEGINHLQIGDIVFTYGPHAEYFKIDVSDRWHGVCVKVPEGLDPALASFTHMGGIAMTAIRKSQIELGDIVAVSGMGAIGNFAAQFAQLQGANVIGIDINEQRIDIARKSGIRKLVNSLKQDLLSTIEEYSKREKISTWIDATGLPSVINESMNLIAPGGEMILLGTPRSEYETNITPFLRKIHLLEDVHIKGALEFLAPTHANEFVKHSIERNSKIIMELMKDDIVKVDPLFSHKLDPKNASEAYFGLRDKPEKYVGVVFDWTI